MQHIITFVRSFAWLSLPTASAAKHPFMQSGPQIDFTGSYEEWGTVPVIAVMEYADPEEAPSVARIDMAELDRDE